MTFSQLKIFFFLLLLTVAAPLFADLSSLGLGRLESFGQTIVGIFTGGFVRTILVMCLAGCAVAYGFNKDNEKMKRNIIAIGVAIAIIVGATSIVEAIWNASGGNI